MYGNVVSYLQWNALLKAKHENPTISKAIQQAVDIMEEPPKHQQSVSVQQMQGVLVEKSYIVVTEREEARTRCLGEICCCALCTTPKSFAALDLLR